MGELDRRFFHGAGFLAAAVAIGGLICFAPASKGHMVLRSLEIAALVTLTVRSLSQAYGKAMPWTDRALAEKWKKQWKLFRNGLLIDVGVFVLSMPLGLPTVWALSIVAGVVLLVILAIREWMLLGRTERCCRKYLRRKIMVDSLGK